MSTQTTLDQGLLLKTHDSTKCIAIHLVDCLEALNCLEGVLLANTVILGPKDFNKESALVLFSLLNFLFPSHEFPPSHPMKRIYSTFHTSKASFILGFGEFRVQELLRSFMEKATLQHLSLVLLARQCYAPIQMHCQSYCLVNRYGHWTLTCALLHIRLF